MKSVKIKGDTAFFGVIMTKTNQNDSILMHFLQDRETEVKLLLLGYHKEIPVGTPIYGRGREAEDDDNADIIIDLNQRSHRIIGFATQYVQRKIKLNSADDFSIADYSDEKPIFGFENFEGLQFQELKKAFNLFRVIQMELNAEDRTKIGEGMVPKYIFGNAIKAYFDHYKVSTP